MLTAAQIEQNKQTFLQLISSVNIENADIAGLIDYLTSTDFFTAPASTIYHGNFDGGLCYHSLNVYNNLVELCKIYDPSHKYSIDSLLVVGLLHDISKANFYEKYVVNKKIYSENGSKHDNQGNFDWFAEDAFKVRDAENRFLAGEHGTNSALIIGQYIPLNLEETASIINHHFISDVGQTIRDITPIYNRYSLAALLHLADMASVYLFENV